MKVILSHPFSGAIYWWFAAQYKDVPSLASKRPGHPYYRTLYGDVDKNIDIALACTVVFDDVILPAADAAIRVQAGDDPQNFPELNLATSDFEVIRQADDAIGSFSGDLLADSVISSILRRVPSRMRLMALLYAAADMLLMSEYSVPVICAPGRRRIVRRLVELNVIDVGQSGKAALDKGAALSDTLEDYTTVTGLTFSSDDAYSLASIKWNDKIRKYAQGFQSALTEASDKVDSGTMFELMADAWSSADLAEDISGTFSSATRALTAVGLIPVPGLSTVVGAAALTTDATSIASARRSERLRWYELGPEIARFRSLQALERKLKQQKLL